MILRGVRRVAGIAVALAAMTSCGGASLRPTEAGTGRVVITQRLEGTGAFVPTVVSYHLDGRPLGEHAVSDEARALRTPTPIAEVIVDAGAHVLEVRVEYRLVGMGVFRYLDGRTGTASFTHEVFVAAQASCAILAIVHERGSPAGPIEGRVAVHFVVPREAPR